MRAALLGAILALATATSSLGLELKDYDSSDSLVRAYLKGVYEGYSWGSVYADDELGGKLLCAPSNFAMTMDQLFDIVDRYIEDNRDVAEKANNMEFIVVLAVRDLFPCD